MLATSLQFVVIARGAVADQELLFFSTLPLVIFASGTRAQFQCDEDAGFVSRDRLLSWKGWAFAYASMAVGTLAKGPVALILPTAVIGLYILLAKTDAEFPDVCKRYTERWRWLRSLASPLKFLRTCWEMRPVTALLMVGLFAAPWYIAVGRQPTANGCGAFFLYTTSGGLQVHLKATREACSSTCW